MNRKKYGLNVVVPRSDTKMGPGLRKLVTELDQETDPLAALNEDKEKN